MNSEYPNQPPPDPDQTRRFARDIGILMLILGAIAFLVFATPKINGWLMARNSGPQVPACDLEPTGNLWERWDLETARQNMPNGLEGTLCSAWITKEVSKLEQIEIGNTSLIDISTLTNTFGLIKFTPGTPETQGNYALGTVKSARSGTFGFGYTNFTGSSTDTFKVARFITEFESKE